MNMQQTSGAHALEYAGFWLRFAAFVIDGFIVGFVIKVMFPLVGWDIWNTKHFWLFFALSAGSYLLAGLLTVVYHAAFWTWRGQTPGMMLLNIKVLRGDGSPVNFGYALLRYVGYIVCGLMLGIGFLWIIWDARKQGIHDKIADTVVVKLPEPVRTDHAMATPRPG
jgi:uncharacterized RDD family membrane protein YckC